MAIAYFQHNFVRRSAGQPKAHAHAAYLSGTKLTSLHGNLADFTAKAPGVIASEVWVPKESPAWAKSRGELWRSLEKREDKTTRPKNAILAHKFIIALPCELSECEMKLLVCDYVRQQFTRRGYAADWAIHLPSREGDQRNYHVHIMVPLRKFICGEWAAKKDRFPTNSPALSLFIREKQKSYFELQNSYLRRNGTPTQVRHVEGKWCVLSAAPTVQSGMMINNTPNTHPGASAIGSLKSTGATNSFSNPQVSADSLVIGQENELQMYAARAAHKKNRQALLGWPVEARKDWLEWGHRLPLKFFERWPELASSRYKLSVSQSF